MPTGTYRFLTEQRFYREYWQKQVHKLITYYNLRLTVRTAQLKLIFSFPVPKSEHGIKATKITARAGSKVLAQRFVNDAKRSQKMRTMKTFDPLSAHQ